MKRILPLLLLALGLSAPAQAQTQLPTLSISDATALEGNSDSGQLRLTVRLSAYAPSDVSVSFKTRDISARAGTDYISTSGQVVIQQGYIAADIAIPITDNSLEEKNRTFLVQLSRSKGATIADSDATATIADDDYSGQISVSDTSFTELNSGQEVAKVQVSLSKPALNNITVNYATGDDTAKASKADYLATSGSLLFKPGRLVLSVSVPILGDTFVEADESFFVSLSVGDTTSSKSLAKSLGVITIVNDDTAPLALSGKIVFESNRNGNLEIFAMNANGTGQIRLTRNSAPDGEAAWSPDGQRIVFRSERDGNPEIYVMNADGTAQTRLTDNAAADTSPAWSPDGTKIVFDSNRDSANGAFKLWAMNADGSDVRPLSVTNCRYADLARGGGRVVFDFSSRIGFSNAEGAAPSVFALSVARANILTASDPAFSPSGTRIAYSLRAQRSIHRSGDYGVTTTVHPYQIYVMNADGTGQIRLTQSSGLDQDPCFSPDGQFISFGSTRAGANSIFVIRADGEGELRLTDGANPSWTSGSVSGVKAPSGGTAPSGGVS